MLISPYAKQNYVDHTMTDQTSIMRFIEDNWLEGQRIGNGSFDALAGTVNGMFDFSHRAATTGRSSWMRIQANRRMVLDMAGSRLLKQEPPLAF